MNQKSSKKSQKVFSESDKLYGMTTVGSKGQVVIPVEARKDLGLNPGDQLMVVGRFGKAIGLMKTEQMREIVDMVMNNVAGTGLEEEYRNHVKKVFGKPPLNKQRKQ